MHQVRFPLDLCPRPRWVSLQRSSGTLGRFKGPYFYVKRSGVGRKESGKGVGEWGEREGKGLHLEAKKSSEVCANGCCQSLADTVSNLCTRRIWMLYRVVCTHKLGQSLIKPRKSRLTDSMCTLITIIWCHKLLHACRYSKCMNFFRVCGAWRHCIGSLFVSSFK